MGGGVALLQEARAAGLAVSKEGHKLVVEGPARLEALARLVLARKAEILDALAADESIDADNTTGNHGEYEGFVSVGSAGAQRGTLGRAEVLASDEQLRLWMTILCEEGGRVGLVDGEPTVTWPEGKDTPGRRRDWDRHRDQLSRILMDDLGLEVDASLAGVRGEHGAGVLRRGLAKTC